jgi:Tol biopolymer transport system component
VEGFVGKTLKHIPLIIFALLQVMGIGPKAMAQTDAAPILFEASKPGEGEGLYVMDADGSNQRRLSVENGAGRAPVWSSDGCKIVFWHETRKPGEKPTKTGIHIMSADGSDQKPVIDDVSAEMEQDLRSYFSPDRSRIAFVSSERGQKNIMVINSDGTSVRKVTDGLYAFNPSWSPDGSKILFQTNGSPPRIRVIHADGTNLQDIGGGSEARWSPDGSKVVFVRAEIASAKQGHSDIIVMSSDGKNVKVLTDSTGMSLHPSWSPDGSRIAFQSLREDDIILEVINADGTNRTKIADHLLFDMSSGGEPSWSPDGSRIAFGRMPFAVGEIKTRGLEAFKFDIYTVAADGSNLKRLTTTGTAGHPVWSPTAKCQGSR